MKSDRLLALVLMVFALAVFLYARDWPMEASLYPRAISVLIFILSSVLLVKPQDERKKTPGSMLQEAIENIDDYTYYSGMSLEDVAYEIVEECYELPEIAQRYFDYEAFARDLGFDGYEETTNGVIYQ